jgi:protoporphyrinogen oxidase
MKIIMLGGGITGAAGAKYAVDKGISDVCLIEKDTRLGGLHKDIQLEGHHYDLGAFFFPGFHTIFNVFNIEDKMHYIESFNPLSLTNKGNLDSYPVTMKGYIKEQGLSNLLLDILGLIKYRIQWNLSGSQFKTADDELQYYFGPFYQKTGLRKYVERLYGMSPASIGLQFSGKRLGYVTDAVRFKTVVSKLATFKFGDLNKWGISPSVYARPSDGFSAMYNYIAEDLKTNNVDVNLGEQIQKILIDEKKIISSDNKVYSYDKLLSSIPIGLLCKLCDVPFNLKLDYKPLYSLFYTSDEEIIPNCQVLFNFTERGFWKRVTLHSSYYGDDMGKSYFIVESIPTDDHLQDSDGVNILDRDFRESFADTEWSDKLKNIQLIGHELTLNAYPIYRNDFKVEALQELKDYFEAKSIFLVGRQGEFDYISSSDAALSSITAIDKILSLR